MSGSQGPGLIPPPLGTGPSFGMAEPAAAPPEPEVEAPAEVEAPLAPALPAPSLSPAPTPTHDAVKSAARRIQDQLVSFPPSSFVPGLFAFGLGAYFIGGGRGMFTRLERWRYAEAMPVGSLPMAVRLLGLGGQALVIFGFPYAVGPENLHRPLAHPTISNSAPRPVRCASPAPSCPVCSAPASRA